MNTFLEDEKMLRKVLLLCLAVLQCVGSNLYVRQKSRTEMLFYFHFKSRRLQLIELHLLAVNLFL